MIRKFAIKFTTITLLSILIVFALENFWGYTYGSIFFLKYSENDKNMTTSLLHQIDEYENIFDNNFFKVTSGEDKDALKDYLDGNYINFPYSMKDFSSEKLYNISLRMLEYYSIVFDSKASVAIQSPDGEDFVKLYDKIEYNYALSEAFKRIMTKIIGKAEEGGFVPDKLTAKIIEQGGCLAGKDEEVEDFEKIFAWFIGYNGLKTSYDVLYFEIMFGKEFLSLADSIVISSQMDEILLYLKMCAPPKALGGRLEGTLDNLYKSYAAKQRLAEYHAFSVLQNEMLEMRMISDIYAARNISAIISSSLGYDAFKTIGSVAVFELYSKKYNDKP